MRAVRLGVLGIALAVAWPLLPQSQVQYTGQNVTGQLALSGTVNLLQEAVRPRQVLHVQGALKPGSTVPEVPPGILPKRLRPPILRAFGSVPGYQPLNASNPPMLSLAVSPLFTGFGFSGLTHLDQRRANGGNQFSVEPPSQGLAVANGYVLEGVNNAVQVYSLSGEPLLPQVVSTNQLFGLAPAIDRATGVNGAFPTDIRVFFDPGTNRWLVLQRAQDYDIWGNPLNSSHLYLAVSQTSDPIGSYNIYTMDTTHVQNPKCPCVADYPQIGADQYGIYISLNEFRTYYNEWADTATILALSKASLAWGASAPTAVQFVIPFVTGYEFAIQPATTPPGASYFVGNSGVQYFVSSYARYAVNNSLSVWAMSNTASLDTANPSLLLTQIVVPTLTYTIPDVSTQRSGPLPYGSSLAPPSPLAYLDGGDSRILSLSYAGGRLYATLGTQVTDKNGRSLAGGAYIILSPAFRSGVLAARVLRQGYLMVMNNHLLRPAIGVNAAGRGAIVFTLVGPDYHPSAAFVPIDTFATAPAIQVAGLGAAPEDGFTGYLQPGMQGIARWGDYSAAVADSDGRIWMATEYIPDAPRTELANWGTFLIEYTP